MKLDRDDYKKLFDDYNFDAKKSDLDVDVDMKIGKWNIEALSGKTLWTPKEPIEYIKTTIPTIPTILTIPTMPADVDISAKLDELLGKPTLIEELTKLVIKDEQDRYIRELLIRNKKLEERIEYLERSNNRREDTIIALREEIGEANSKIDKYLDENGNRYIYQDSLGEDWYFSDLDIFNELRELVNTEEVKNESR